MPAVRNCASAELLPLFRMHGDLGTLTLTLGPTANPNPTLTLTLALTLILTL